MITTLMPYENYNLKSINKQIIKLSMISCFQGVLGILKSLIINFISHIVAGRQNLREI